MGYTHYLKQRGDLGSGWSEFCDDVRAVIAEVERGDIVIAGWDGEGAPEIGLDRVAFNGSASQVIDSMTGETGDAETAEILRAVDATESWRRNDAGEALIWCKTGRMPYDAAVVAVYALAAERWPDTLTIRSDGLEGDWAAGVELARRAVHRDVPVPPAIEQVR